ncbi:TetR family transcriptional regulator [Burkholderia singularis]|uniref:TetR family transcriptional regulator n=1 Tax=Burkholderia singularis TaxID=1503053 RepID=A0A103DVU5_9BURK|nr:TetR family transcriptional regulator [Burkholderia singularis]KVE23653.1 TetR family transcriptional regulator [Burkholderia singularis]SMG00385.1 Transcription repressor of multidrug efflux pump acrAB operon, TetR (AcrR) family [Burkholderia singularis]
MVRRTKEEALATRDRILDAAEHVFFEKGVSHTSLADIARHAGVTRGAIYWHFASKSELFDAMFDRVLMPLDELKADTGKTLADPLGRVREILTWCLLGAARDPQLQRVFSILFMKCEYVADMGPLLERHRAGMLDALNNLEADLAQAVANGQMPADLDTWRASLMLHTLVSGFVRDMLMLPNEIDANCHAEKLVDACLDMLRTSASMRRDPA